MNGRAQVATTVGMPIALIPQETWKYQLVDDRMKDADGRRTRDSKLDPNGTIWTLRAIPASVHAHIEDEINLTGDGICPNRGTVKRLLLEHGVEAVENWKDADGRDIALRKRTVSGRDVVDLEFLDRLTLEHRVELANAIEAREKVTPAEGN